MKMQNAECSIQKRVKSLVICLSAFCIVHYAFVSEASAEIVIFKNGRTMSAKSHQIVGEMATLQLRDGGQVTFPASIIERIDPDEVPYPEEQGAQGAPSAERAQGAETAQGAHGAQMQLIADEVLAARPFADLISTVAAAHDVDVRLVHAVIEQESNYEARARSKKGARGLMQLMPATARQYGVRNSFDPKTNLDAGVRHLKSLMSRLDLPMALAAYNAGEGTVQRYGGLPPYPETLVYVRNILRRLGRSAGN
jgi:soluble lytic murein transglycosylase-like protein